MLSSGEEFTHYFYRKKQVVDPELFNLISCDVKKLLKNLSPSIAGPDGSGAPIINRNEIRFNGLRQCGHPKKDLGIPWPITDAQGIAESGEDVSEDKWLCGDRISKRTCDGSCAGQAFEFLRVENPDSLGSLEQDIVSGWLLRKCSTSFKPYDLAVNCVLIIISYYLNGKFLVACDAGAYQWYEAREICQTKLGYGVGFESNKSSELMPSNW